MEIQSKISSGHQVWFDLITYFPSINLVFRHFCVFGMIQFGFAPHDGAHTIISLVDDPNITSRWTPLSHRHGLADFSLSYINCYGLYSSELSCIIHLAKPTGETLQTEASPKYTVEIRKCRTTRFDPRGSRLWNSLPAAVLPPTPNLHIFKSRANKLPLSPCDDPRYSVFKFKTTRILSKKK